MAAHKQQSHELQDNASSRSLWRSSSRKFSTSHSMMAYVGVFLMIMSIVAIGYQPPEHISASASSVDVKNPSIASGTEVSVDDLVSTSVAANIAQTVDLPVAANVANMSQSMAAESVLSQNDTNIVAKPQIIQPTASSREIKSYTAQTGDTVQSIASKYGINAQTVKWANNMNSDAVEPGRTMKILPMNGILYKAKAGESIDAIASKYGSNVEQIRSLNDLEINGIRDGQELLVPNGNLPENERPGYVAPRSTSYYSSSSISVNPAYVNASAGNRYAFGNCTWYAYERRLQLGKPVGSFWGNAATWAAYGSAAGFRVDGNPEPGAVMQNGGGYGHVAIVESVDPGKSVTYSDMNGVAGFNRVGTATVDWSRATSGMYRYIH